MKKKSDQPDVIWIENWLSDQEAEQLFERLFREVNWQHLSVKMFGKQILQPRLQCWMGEKNYTYSGLKMVPEAWHPALLPIVKTLEETFDIAINSVLINLYRDGKDYMGYHRDNEKELGDEPVICSLSLGQARKFVLRKRDRSEKREYMLTSGSLLVMRGDTQQEWEHALPKSLRVTEPRINLTFRFIHD